MCVLIVIWWTCLMPKRLALVALTLLTACGEPEPSSSNGAKTAGLPEAGTPEHDGRLSFGQCAVCHSYNEGQNHRVGPNLFNIYGVEAGKAEGFNYTTAMRESGIVWNDENLDAFMENPQIYVRGNRMAYMGEHDPQTRANIIAFLKTLKSAED